MAEKEAENSLNEDARNTQPTSNNSLHRDLELENQELKKKLDEALETCRSSRVYTREIELDKSKLEEILKVNRLGEDQFLISMEQQMRQRREWNSKCSELQGLGVEPLTKKRKLEGEYIEDIKYEIKYDISETMQKESDKSVEDTTDEVVVCGDDIVKEGDTIEDDSAVDLKDESVYDDDNNPSDMIEANETINENYDNTVIDLTDAMEVQKEQKQLEAQDSNEKLKAEEKIKELTLKISELSKSYIRLQKDKDEILDSINDKLKKFSPKEPSPANQEELNPETKKDIVMTKLNNLIERNRVLQTRVNTEKQLVQNLKEDKCKDLTEIERLKDNLAITKKKIDELNIDHEDLNKTKNINKDLVGEALKIKEELNDSIKNMAVLKEEKEQLLQKVQDLEVKVSQIEKQSETSNYKLNSQTIQLVKIKNMLKEFSSGTEKDDVIAQLTKLINQNRNLRKIVSTQDQDLKNNRNEITKLKDGSVFKQLQEQIKAKLVEITHLKQEIIYLKKGNGMLQEEREDLRSTINQRVGLRSYRQGVYNVGENRGGCVLQFGNIVDGNNEAEEEQSRGALEDRLGGRQGGM